MPLKTIKGPYGQANEYDIPSISKKYGPNATLVTYYVNVPWANALWTSYEVGVMHMRPVPGLPDPKISLSGATHEVFVFALKDGPFHPCRGGARLTSQNYGGQFVTTSDAEAVEFIEKAVQDCVNGDLSPDTDYTQHWIARFGSSNIKGDPATAGQTIVTVGKESMTFDPKPLSKKPKDELCRFCGMPAVATVIVGDQVCLRCSTIHQDKIDIKNSLIYKLMQRNVTGK
jgi:hypothetical protein